MALATRKPSGKPSWPTMLIAGRPGGGRSWTAAEATGSPRLGRAFWIEIGETVADEYGSVPGAEYEIVDHDGTYHGIKRAVAAAAAEPFENGQPNLIVVDTFGRLWDLLSDEAQEMANRREAAKAARYKKPAPDPDADFNIGTDLWNRAKRRWYAVLDMLIKFQGPSILLSRLDETSVMDADGYPTKEKIWKVRGHKDFAADVDIVIEVRKFREFTLTKARSTTWSIPEGQEFVLPDFSIERLLDRLGVGADTVGTHNVTTLDPTAVDPGVAEASAEKPTVPEDFELQIKAAVGADDMEKITALWHLANQAGDERAKAVATVAGKEVKQQLELLARAAAEQAAEPDGPPPAEASAPARGRARQTVNA
ncbi:hypothetical protein D1871_10960 [Nakamurella silvestris]|nr:hypothetical protein D1871_10960 [Nakamurella silvestris]